MFIKVCGITTKEQIDWAIDLGFSAVGFVIYKNSKRFVDYNKFIDLTKYASGKIKIVAVSKGFDDLKDIYDQVDYIQFYKGEYSDNINENKIIFAGSNIFSNKNYKYFLYDISYGSGEFEGFPKQFPVPKDKLIIAGGLNPKNIKEIIKNIKPAGVDVSSGVEQNAGLKNFNLMKEFIKEVKCND